MIKKYKEIKKHREIKKVRKTPVTGGTISAKPATPLPVDNWVTDFNNPNITLTRRTRKK